MQSLNCPAGNGREGCREDCMDQAARSGRDHLQSESSGGSLVFEIRLSDRLWVLEKDSP